MVPTVTMLRLPLLLLLVLCPLARSAVPQPLQDAIAKLAKDTDRWAYTQTTVQKDDKGRPKSEIVMRFDPSKPYAEQYQLLKIDGKEPSDSQQKKYRRHGSWNNSNGRSLACLHSQRVFHRAIKCIPSIFKLP